MSRDADQLAAYVAKACAAYSPLTQRRQLASELADLKIMIACVEAELAAAGVDLESMMRRSLARAFEQLPGDR